jgi:GLPGLI family protein
VNGDDSTTTTLIRILDKKYCYESIIYQSIPGYNAVDSLQILYDSTDTKEIAGISCNKAIATFYGKHNEKQTLSMYYANNLNIPFGNAYNPYSKIPGILLQFKVMFNGINMEFTAQQVEYKDIEEAEFLIPEDFEKVDRAGIEAVMQKYLPQK